MQELTQDKGMRQRKVQILPYQRHKKHLHTNPGGGMGGERARKMEIGIQEERSRRDQI
jgi:hypothetical protein